MLKVVTSAPALGGLQYGGDAGPVPGGGAHLADVRRVRHEYDARGDLVGVATHRGRRFAARGDSLLVTRYGYDRLGRKRWETLQGVTRRYSHDAAGNLTAWDYGRGQVTARYDALNRLERRVSPGRTDAPVGCAAFIVSHCFYLHPFRGEVRIAADTAVFDYDAAGNLRAADNRYARVRRGYTPGGLLAVDSLLVRGYWAAVDEPGDPSLASAQVAESTYVPTPRTCRLPGEPPSELPPCDALTGGAGAPADAAAAGAASPGSSARFGQHVHVLTHGYDLSGRRLSTTRTALPGLGAPTTRRYEYDAAGTGELRTVVDHAGQAHTFWTDTRGRPVASLHPGGVRVAQAYDDDDRLTSRSVNGPRLGDARDSLTYDARGRVRSAQSLLPGSPSSPPYWETTEIAYTGLGAVASTARNTASGTSSVEVLLTDAVGNRLAQQNSRDVYDPEDPAGSRFLRYTPEGRLDLVTSRLRYRMYEPDHAYWQRTDYDGAGNQSFQYTRDGTTPPGGGDPVSAGAGAPAGDPKSGGPIAGDAATPRPAADGAAATSFLRHVLTGSYSDAENRLRAFARHAGIAAVSSDAAYPGQRGVYEEYRYDALGRRVVTRSRRDARGCQATVLECQSYVQRAVWDGDDLIAEWRNPEARDGAGAAIEAHGALAEYTHAGGAIDRPLVVTGPTGVPLVVHHNWRGAPAFGTQPGGAACGPLLAGDGLCPSMSWPAVDQRVDRSWGPADGGEWPVRGWAGSLLTESTDGSGLQYMRNRYYDPATGRFTQMDPIGLAGGLNVYGFAGGDPVNFSDPFGLCPKTSYESVCIDLFIAGQTAGPLRGDGRTFDAGADPSRSRAQIVINVENPSKSFYTVSPTCTAGGDICNAPLDDNSVKITRGGDGSFGVKFSLTNSITRVPAIDGNVSLSRNASGGWTSHGERDAFPSMGIYSSKNGSQRTIWQSREHSGHPPADLAGIHKKKW